MSPSVVKTALINSCDNVLAASSFFTDPAEIANSLGGDDAINDNFHVSGMVVRCIYFQPVSPPGVPWDLYSAFL
jgi:hypothetical protein